MSRSRLVWVRLITSWSYAAIFIAVMLWLLVEQFLSARKVDWSTVAGLLVFLALIVFGAWLRVWRINRRAVATIRPALPDAIDLDSSGLKTRSNDGANSFTPWNAFKGWRVGQKVLLLDLREGIRSVILPFASLSTAEQETLRGTVQSYLGPPSNRR